MRDFLELMAVMIPICLIAVMSFALGAEWQKEKIYEKNPLAACNCEVPE